MENGQYFFKHMFDSVCFTYVFGLSTIIQELLRFHHRKILYPNRSEKLIVLDPPEFGNHVSEDIFNMFDVR